MATVSINVKNGTTGPNYDVLGDNATIDALTGILQYLAVQSKRRDADTTVSEADGAYVGLTTDRRGRLRVVDTQTLVPIAVTPVINTSIYAALDQVGAVNTFTNAAAVAGGSGRVVSAILTDRAKQKANLSLILFAVSPTLVSANNAPFDITDPNVEAAKIVGMIDFPTASYRDSASNSFAVGTPVGIAAGGELGYKTDASANLFGVFYLLTGTPTYASVSDLVCTLTVRYV